MSEATPSPLRPDPAIVTRIHRLVPDLSATTLATLERFLTLLHVRNAQVNLTAVRDPQAMWLRHILDSLSLLPWFPHAGRAADLGSGGGLPALPLAITRPQVALTLVDSVGKKARFLSETVETLGLVDRVQVVHDRIETLGRSRLRERMDVVTARALARLPVLLELSLPLLRSGGKLLAIKGEQAQLEIDESARALAALHAKVEHVERTETGTVVVVRKHGTTPERYPRGPGEPKRKPL